MLPEIPLATSIYWQQYSNADCLNHPDLQQKNDKKTLFLVPINQQARNWLTKYFCTG